MKRFLIISSMVLIPIININANELDYAKDSVKGWTMYKEKKLEKKKEDVVVEAVKIKKKSENSTINDLKDALTVIAEELRRNRKELKLIKQYINPNAPHYIIGKDGKECLANSSKDCWEMPIIQEGRNQPALKNFMKDPSVENAKIWLGVQAKIFNRANDMGIALKFASLEGGSEVYPVEAVNLISSMQASNMTVQRNATLIKMDELKDNLGTIIFLGRTPTVEKAWRMETLARMIYPKDTLYNLLIVYENEETKMKYDTFYEHSKKIELKKIYENSRKKVDSSLFDTYNIDITPSVVAIYKDEKKGQFFRNTIAKGFPSRQSVLRGIKRFLTFNKILKHQDFHSSDIWRADNGK